MTDHRPSPPAAPDAAPVPDDPLRHSELTLLLGLAFQLLLGEFNGRVGEAGYTTLRPLHGFAFQALGPHGATGSELAARLGITKQAAGQLVDDLERRGYLRREPHPAGGRRKLIRLTDAARTHLFVAGDILHGLEKELAVRLRADAVEGAGPTDRDDGTVGESTGAGDGPEPHGHGHRKAGEAESGRPGRGRPESRPSESRPAEGHPAGSEPSGDEAELSLLRAELIRVIRALAGDEVPPLRPVW